MTKKEQLRKLNTQIEMAHYISHKRDCARVQDFTGGADCDCGAVRDDELIDKLEHQAADIMQELCDDELRPLETATAELNEAVAWGWRLLGKKVQ